MEVPKPEPGPDEVLIRVRACGVCRTDLHVIEGELAIRKPNVIPGHQVVGVVEASGAESGPVKAGTRVGVHWLHRTCGVCEYCRSGRENLCDRPDFTGWTVNGGYAEYLVAPVDFVYRIPDRFEDIAAAPLLCTGVTGFRCLRLAGISSGARLGLFGFGSAGLVTIQVARHWGVDVYVSTREEKHRRLAMEHGAQWAGGADETAACLSRCGDYVRAGRRTGSAGTPGPEQRWPPDPGWYSHEPDSFIQLRFDLSGRIMRSVANNTRRQPRF